MTNAENTTDLIEYLRKKMIALAEETGDLVHPDVVRVSQRLDLYLVQFLSQQKSQDALADTDVPSVRPMPSVAGAPIQVSSWQTHAKMRKHLRSYE